VNNISLLLIAHLAINLTVSAQSGPNHLTNTAIPVLLTNETAPKGSIKGKITTADGKPAAFVTVVIKEVNRGTTTDEYGDFTIKNLKDGQYTLSISSIGLKPVEKQLSVFGAEGVEVAVSLEETASQLAEVVVTDKRSLNHKPVSIGKLPVAVMDMPQAVAVIGQGVIRDQQAQRLSDVVKNINGVYLASTRAGTQETFNARGYGFSSNNMFKNGSRVNTGAMPEMSSLERVEVLKGSAAILYGNVAPGGILNMVTKQPKFEGGGEISMRAGSYDLYKPSFDVYGPLSGRIAYRVNGTFESANSFRDVVSSKRYYVNPSLLFKLGERTELLVQGDYLKHDFTPDFGIGSIDTIKISPLPRNTFLGADWQYAHTQQATASTQLKHQLNEAWQISGTLSYQKYKRDYYSTERIQADVTGKWVRPLGKTKTDEDYYFAQADLTGKFSTGAVKHTFLAGVDADRYFTRNYTYDQPATYDVINILDPSKETAPRRTDIPAANELRRINAPVTRFGAYVQDLISISEKFKVLAGVRWTWLENNRLDSVNFKTGAHTKGSTKNDQAFSPRFGVVYQPLSNMSVFASYSNSFTQNSGIDIYGAIVKPSLIDQFEVGVKNDFFKGALSANITVYRIKNNNLAQTAPFDKDGNPNNNTNIKALIGETTSDGLEIDIQGHPLPGLDVIAGYSYNDIYVSATPGTKGSFYKGDRLVNNPHHTANATVFYTLGATALKGLKLGVTAFYMGERGAGWNNTYGQTQTRSRMINVDGYTTLDISAGYSFKYISVLAKVSNVTNVYNYTVHENYSVNPIPPTQLTATVAYRFRY
jgi:iron complex outermembrane receptor protein